MQLPDKLVLLSLLLFFVDFLCAFPMIFVFALSGLSEYAICGPFELIPVNLVGTFCCVIGIYSY